MPVVGDSQSRGGAVASHRENHVSTGGAAAIAPYS